MEKITSIIFLLLILIGCENPDKAKSFVKYVDYSGMMLTNLNTVSLPDSQVVLDLGSLCFAGDKLRYSRYGSHYNDSNWYFKNDCFEVTHGCKTLRNYLDSVPERIKSVWIDTLLLNSNEIKSIPVWLYQKKIKHLDLTYNKIKETLIPKDCSVESIDLRHNLFNEMPSGVFECKKLKRLYLDKNLKKHKVETDTILVHGKTLIFGYGIGDVSPMEGFLMLNKSQWPKAIQLEEW